MTDAYHQQLIAQRDAARQALKAAEDELGPLRRRVQELAAERDQATAGVPLICSDERHDAKVRGLEAVLREVLATFVHKVHPGRPCLQSQMIATERVAKWRAVLNGTACPTPCDTDCAAGCHETHAVTWKRDHEPTEHGPIVDILATHEAALDKAEAHLFAQQMKFGTVPLTKVCSRGHGAADIAPCRLPFKHDGWHENDTDHTWPDPS